MFALISSLLSGARSKSSPDVRCRWYRKCGRRLLFVPSSILCRTPENLITTIRKFINRRKWAESTNHHRNRGALEQHILIHRSEAQSAKSDHEKPSDGRWENRKIKNEIYSFAVCWRNVWWLESVFLRPPAVDDSGFVTVINHNFW